MLLSLLAPAGHYLVRKEKNAVHGGTAQTVTDSGTATPSAADAATVPTVQSLCDRFHRTICKVRGVTHDPTGVVRPDVQGEIQALRLYEEIIRKHPDWESEQVDEELARSLFTPARRARLFHVFRWVRQNMVDFIRHQPGSVFDSVEKRSIRRQLERVELRIPPPVSLYGDEPDLLTKNDVYFERMADGSLRLRVGGAFLFTSKSWFNMVFTFAHELAHSIDPCEVRVERLSFPAYDRLSACLVEQGVVSLSPQRVECGDNDQLSEAFADWLGVQITVKALKNYSTEFHGEAMLGAVINSVRDLCEQEESLDEPDLTVHPSPKTRIGRIFGQNPDVRAVLGCAPTRGPAYCDFAWEGRKK